MRRTTTRIAVGLAVAAAGASALMGSPASAKQAEAQTGLTFYEGTFAAPVLNVADPDGSCAPFPATAASLAGSGPVEQVLAYRTADCVGTAVGLGTLRTFSAGEYRSFRAF